MEWQSCMIEIDFPKLLGSRCDISKNVHWINVLWAFVIAVLVASCGSEPTKPQTLGDIDTTSKPKKYKKVAIQEKSSDDVKRAYYDYIADAAKNDRFRLQAATRIAELELSLKHAQESDENEAAFNKKVKETIQLLEEALKDFPNSPDNDHSLYQLAKAYDQIAENEKAIGVLKKLVSDYPSSPYFVESKFRIAEYAFIRSDYFVAEDAYTDVIRSKKNDVFYEKALFKRGWARYKQELYEDALSDFYQAVLYHKFTPYEDLVGAERELFDEYFRAIGLTFTYLGGVDAIYAYHKSQGKPIYVYRTYDTVAKLFLKQERYSDSVAVYQGYMKYYPVGDRVVEAGINIQRIWKDAGFFNRYVESFERFYGDFHIGSSFWRKSDIPVRESQYQQANESIRKNTVLLSSYYHNQYSKSKKTQHFVAAEKWYERYLSEYSAFARQDKIYPLYAQLLEKNGKQVRALAYYELAAYDGDIVLDKESAYASVFITNKLFLQSQKPEVKKDYLDKHLRYAEAYAQFYPNEKHSSRIVLNAVQQASKANRLDTVIAIANLLPPTATERTQSEVNLLKGQAFFDLDLFSDAELLYQDLLAQPNLTKQQYSRLEDKLALTLYKQAEMSRDSQLTAEASNYFLRIVHELPNSELAPTAMYDAIALYLQSEQWDMAIRYLNAFKQKYPNKAKGKDISQKLSLAYLKSNRSVEAAREFEKLSDFVTDREEKMAAQWQAAKLYYEKQEWNSALRAYKEYAHTYKRPYAEYMESMHVITDIYQRLGDRSKKEFWLRKILQADGNAAVSSKTDRTNYISANAAYTMAYLQRDEFSRVRLRIPLAKSLKRKKTSMQAAVKYYGRAATYGHEDFVTQSTLAIAEIYQEFAVALMNSERPKNLNADELEQYNILIEDQVFPFEDKSIEFHEANIKRIAGGTYDKAIKQSLSSLKTLYPARYAREPKVDLFVPIDEVESDE